MSWSIPPPREPIAFSIFGALTAEQDKREGRSVDEWMRRELNSVWHRCSELAGRQIPREDVESAMRNASGHIDYPHKVAYYCAELVREAWSKP